MKEYVEREQRKWTELQEAIAAMDSIDDLDAISAISPFHEQLRCLMLLKRSSAQAQHLPIIWASQKGTGTSFESTRAAMLQSYQEYRALPGNQGVFTTAGRQLFGSRSTRNVRDSRGRDRTNPRGRLYGKGIRSRFHDRAYGADDDNDEEDGGDDLG